MKIAHLTKKIKNEKITIWDFIAIALTKNEIIFYFEDKEEITYKLKDYDIEIENEPFINKIIKMKGES